MFVPEVHVWLIDVEDEAAAGRALSLLPAAERERLGRQLEPQRRRAVCAQAALRILTAAGTTGVPPLPELVRGWNGKPVLMAWGSTDDGGPPTVARAPTCQGTDHEAQPRVHVSLSHAGGVAAVALTTAGIVGVDVEQLRTVPDADGLARTAMSEFEYAQWRRTRDSRRPAALWRAWTRKEAVLKALGTGLGGGLRSVSAPLAPGRDGRVEVLSLPDAAGDAAAWSLHDLPGWSDYLGAVAVRAPEVTVRQHEMTIGELLRCAAADRVIAGPPAEAVPVSAPAFVVVRQTAARAA